MAFEEIQPIEKTFVVKRWDDRFVDYSQGGPDPGPKRAKLTLEEAWQIAQTNIHLEFDLRNYKRDWELHLEADGGGIEYYAPGGTVEDAAKAQALMDALCSGRTTFPIEPDERYSDIPQRVRALLYGVPWPYLLGCVKERTPPIFWLGE